MSLNIAGREVRVIRPDNVDAVYCPECGQLAGFIDKDPPKKLMDIDTIEVGCGGGFNTFSRAEIMDKIKPVCPHCRAELDLDNPNAHHSTGGWESTLEG